MVMVGALMHFTWERISGIGALRWLAVFVPVNESNWEHAKMGTYPLLVWALTLLVRRGGVKNLKSWLLPAALAIWSAYFVMFGLHSAMSHALGDIGIAAYVGAFAAGIAHGMMVFRMASGWAISGRLWAFGAVLIAAKLMMLVAFTYFPPHIPLFLDSLSGAYGILP